MTEERLKQYIEDRRTKCDAESYLVPEGYFDSLCDRVMSQLPDQQTARHRRLIPRKWRMAIAAVMVGVVAGSTFLFLSQNSNDVSTVGIVELEAMDEDGYYYDEDYVDEAMEYAVVNNHEIVAYLADN